ISSRPGRAATPRWRRSSDSSPATSRPSRSGWHATYDTGMGFHPPLFLRLEQPRHHVGHVLSPQRPDVRHVRHFLFGELHALRLQPLLELTVHANEAVSRAADDPEHPNL